MQTTVSAERGESPFQFKSIVVSALVTLIAALVINAIIYVVFDLLDAFPSDVILEQADGPLTLGNVIFATASGVIGAAILWALLTRFTRSPFKLFRIIATVVFLLSLFSPFSIDGAPGKMIAGLLLMHLATFACCLLILPRPARSPFQTESLRNVTSPLPLSWQRACRQSTD